MTKNIAHQLEIDCFVDHHGLAFNGQLKVDTTCMGVHLGHGQQGGYGTAGWCTVPPLSWHRGWRECSQKVSFITAMGSGSLQVTVLMQTAMSLILHLLYRQCCYFGRAPIDGFPSLSREYCGGQQRRQTKTTQTHVVYHGHARSNQLDR